MCATKNNCWATCLVEAGVEVRVHGAAHDARHIRARVLQPAPAQVVEGLGDEGLMFTGLNGKGLVIRMV